MRKLRAYIAVCLLIVLAVFVFPKEFIHALYGHEDTVCTSTGETSVDSLHQHCEILNFNVPLFLGVFRVFTAFSGEFRFPFYLHKKLLPSLAVSRLLPSRAPPFIAEN